MRSDVIQKVFQSVRGYYFNIFTGFHSLNNNITNISYKNELLNHFKYDERILTRSRFYDNQLDLYKDIHINIINDKNLEAIFHTW